jgi:Na+-transporting NADH:ubiquinone oxidoreductase subunit F
VLTEIGLPVAVFTLIVVALAAFVLTARHRLEPTGDVTINVNGERTLTVGAGDRLLWTLAAHGIFLPAACGGRGACGQCRVTVRSGGGAPLPTELAQLGSTETAAGARLACQLKVRGPLEIAVPQSALDVRRWTCTVLSNVSVATYLKELVLALPSGERLGFVAGQYVLLEAPPGRVSFRDFALDDAQRREWQHNGLLGLESVAREPVVRAYSLANTPQDDDRAVLVVRIATPPAAAPGAPPGRASSFVFSLAPGDSVTISGPFGEFRATGTARELVLIGGGAGIAPLRSIVLDQLARSTGRKMSLWYGVRDQLDLCYERELGELAARHENFELHVALSKPRREMSWTGLTGFIHRVVHERYLRGHAAPREVEYYLCGPPLMTAAVTEMLDDLGVPKQNVFCDDFGA